MVETGTEVEVVVRHGIREIRGVVGMEMYRSLLWGVRGGGVSQARSLLLRIILILLRVFVFVLLVFILVRAFSIGDQGAYMRCIDSGGTVRVRSSISLHLRWLSPSSVRLGQGNVHGLGEQSLLPLES